MSKQREVQKQGIEQFLSQSPDDAESWANATDEPRDLYHRLHENVELSLRQVRSHLEEMAGKLQQGDINGVLGRLEQLRHPEGLLQVLHNELTALRAHANNAGWLNS